jgi:G6PDH family F420-dependent oxidoreductase
MATFGYFLSTEEHPPQALVDQAARAEQAGFEAAWISDHFHPWNDEQGQAPFVWAVLGGISQRTERLRVHTAVTAPIVRIHPAIVAQAAATAATMLPGRFGLGVGTGEALNEHVLGDPWPSVNIRLEMLEEAVGHIRALWEGGTKTRYGDYYVIDRARLYTLPDEPPPIHVSAFGPKAVEVAARIGDGYMNTEPSAELLQLYRDHGGRGTAHGGMKVCWAESEDEAKQAVHRLWANEGLPGELAQLLPTPTNFEEASELVTPDMLAESIPCGPDPERHVQQIRAYLDAGYDEVYIGQIGTDQEGFFRFFEQELRPRLS